jgi:hypothetical protein
MRRNVRTLITHTAAALAATVALTGCIKMDMDMKLSSSEKVSGSVIVGFSDQAITMMGQKPADFSKEMMKEANTSVKDPKNALPKDAKVETKAYSKNGFTGVQTTFSNIPINELGKATGQPRMRRAALAARRLRVTRSRSRRRVTRSCSRDRSIRRQQLA